jgi:hypothetical protein
MPKTTKNTEKALVDLVKLIQSLKQMEDANWAEVTLDAIIETDEYAAAQECFSKIVYPSQNFKPTHNGKARV